MALNTAGEILGVIAGTIAAAAGIWKAATYVDTTVDEEVRAGLKPVEQYMQQISQDTRDIREDQREILERVSNIEGRLQATE